MDRKVYAEFNYIICLDVWSICIETYYLRNFILKVSASRNSVVRDDFGRFKCLLGGDEDLEGGLYQSCSQKDGNCPKEHCCSL